MSRRNQLGAWREHWDARLEAIAELRGEDEAAAFIARLDERAAEAPKAGVAGD